MTLLQGTKVTIDIAWCITVRSSKSFGLIGWVSKSNFTDDIARGQRS